MERTLSQNEILSEHYHKKIYHKSSDQIKKKKEKKQKKTLYTLSNFGKTCHRETFVKSLCFHQFEFMSEVADAEQNKELHR